MPRINLAQSGRHASTRSARKVVEVPDFHLHSIYCALDEIDTSHHTATTHHVFTYLETYIDTEQTSAIFTATNE